MTRTYAYCVGPVGLAGEWGSDGIGGSRVYAVRRGGLAALVSALPEGAGVPLATRTHLLAHDFDVRVRLNPLRQKLRELVPVNRQRRPRRDRRRRRRLHHD